MGSRLLRWPAFCLLKILKNIEFLRHLQNVLERVQKSTLICGISYFLDLLVFENFYMVRLTGQ